MSSGWWSVLRDRGGLRLASTAEDAQARSSTQASARAMDVRSVPGLGVRALLPDQGRWCPGQRTRPSAAATGGPVALRRAPRRGSADTGPNARGQRGGASLTPTAALRRPRQATRSRGRGGDRPHLRRRAELAGRGRGNLTGAARPDQSTRRTGKVGCGPRGRGCKLNQLCDGPRARPRARAAAAVRLRRGRERAASGRQRCESAPGGTGEVAAAQRTAWRSAARCLRDANCSRPIFVGREQH